MTKYTKLKADSNSQTFLYLLEKPAEKKYLIFKKAVYPDKKNIYLFFKDLQIAESRFNQLIS
ncbi:MAG TPA: hypothetical protein PKK61_11315 [Defluviitaleaceae bacterium]|jgi:hypothetical protein|nr:hypothetical protein [Candidatus Epulonipiscium sp.]HOA81631.1 hypothetical protein [Defluviitaleaceae bacterium]